MTHPERDDCCGPERGLSRRSFLAQGIGAGLGALLARPLAALAAPPPAGAARACILVWLSGGASQLETFDPKPGTLNGGPTRAIDTAVRGLRFAEPLPMLAERAKRLAVIRSMTSREGDHARASYFIHTGYAPSTTVRFPTFGSVIAAEGARVADGASAPAADIVPPFVCLGPDAIGPGYRGVEHAAFVVDRGATALDPMRGLDERRIDERRALHRALEEGFARQTGLAPETGEETGTARTAAFERATGLLRGPLREALELRREPAASAGRYGAAAAGRGLLAARRLVESGVRCVEVVLGGWDDHDRIFEAMPPRTSELDRALAALIDDLGERERLDETLIVCLGEFGRTPTINPREGRDHFPAVFSALLAGGGVRGGAVVGASSDDGTRVVERPVTVPELLATVVSRLGIDPDAQRYAGDRPMRVVDHAKPVSEVLPG